MRNRLGFAPVTLAALSLAGPAWAQRNFDLTFHGYVSQGYLNSSSNNFLGAQTESGTFAYTEEALNFNVKPIARLRIGGQLLGRDLGPVGNHKVTVDWFLGDYRFEDWFGVRMGKVKLPNGLYGTVTDADVARPEILQPQGLYPLINRDLTIAYSGASAYGTAALGGGGELDYEIYGGTIDIDGAPIVEQNVRSGAVSGLKGLVAAGVTGGDYLLGDVKANVTKLWGGMVEWRPPLPGLRLRLSGYTNDSEFSSQTLYTGTLGRSPVVFSTRSKSTYEQPYSLFISAEYERGNLRLSAEHFRSENRFLTTVTGLPFPGPPATPIVTKPFACYGQAVYRFTKWFQASSYYMVTYTDRDDKEGKKLVATGQPAHRRWLKDWAFTGRFDINQHWLFKAEVHIFDGTAYVDPLDNPQGLKQDWNMLALKTTLHF